MISTCVVQGSEVMLQFIIKVIVLPLASIAEATADAAMYLDQVELCGRPMKVGRPKGWIDPKQVR